MGGNASYSRHLQVYLLLLVDFYKEKGNCQRDSSGICANQRRAVNTVFSLTFHSLCFQRRVHNKVGLLFLPTHSCRFLTFSTRAPADLNVLNMLTPQEVIILVCWQLFGNTWKRSPKATVMHEATTMKVRGLLTSPRVLSIMKFWAGAKQERTL